MRIAKKNFFCFALALAIGCSSRSHDSRRDDDRDDDDRHSSRKSATSSSAFHLELDGASLADALTAYRKATGRDLSMRDSLQKRLSCVTLTMSIEAESADDLDIAFAAKLGEKGLKIEDHLGIRQVARDYKQPSPCGDPLDTHVRPRHPPAIFSALPPPSAHSDADDDVLDGIVEVSETHFRMERHTLEALMGGSIIQRGARFVSDPVGGFRVYAIKKGSALSRLGIQNGDILRTINGFEFTNQDKALESYAKLKTANELDLEIERRSKPLHILIDVVPDGSLPRHPAPAKPKTPLPSRSAHP
jgi:hypothetical protein